MTSRPQGRLRRAARHLLDSAATWGSARAGVAGGERSGRILFTRFAANQILSSATFEEREQSERQRALWSSIGALLLALLGSLTLVYGNSVSSMAWMAFGVAELASSIGVGRAIVVGMTKGNSSALLGIAAVVGAALWSTLNQPPQFGNWELALAAIATEFAAALCLVLGRR